MGLLTNKNNEISAEKVLEDMLEKFEINIDNLEDIDRDNEEFNIRRKKLEEKNKLEF